MEGVIIVVLVIVGISIVVGIIKAIFECIADTVKGIFEFIAEHYVAIVVVLVGIGLLCWWNSPEGQRRQRLRTSEARYAQELQELKNRRDGLSQKLGMGEQEKMPLNTVKTFQEWMEAARRRDSRVTEAECRQMFLKYLNKQAELLQAGSASWPGLVVRIRDMQEEANALLPDSEQSDFANQKAACAAEKVSP